MRQAESLSRHDGHYRLRLSDGSVLAARAVIIATGVTYRRLGIPALEDLQGRGVFYGAAASEAPAMRGRNVFVAGGGNSAGQAALHLAKWADKVTVLVRAQSLAGSMSDYLIREIGPAPNVDVRYGVQVADGTRHRLPAIAGNAGPPAGRGAASPPTHCSSSSAHSPARNGSATASHAISGNSSSPAQICAPAPATAGAPPAAAARDQPARGVRRRRRAPQIGQTGRLRRRRRRCQHPPGTPLPANHRCRISRRGPNPSLASAPTTGTQPEHDNVPTPTEHNVTAIPQARRPEMKQIMTQAPAQKPPFHPQAAAATVADVMRPPLTTVGQDDHLAAAAYLMKHAGTTPLMVMDAQTGQPAGIITGADIADAIADGKDVNDLWADAVMPTRPAVTATTSIRDAAEIMTARHFRHLPVAGDTGSSEWSTSSTCAGRCSTPQKDD
jgi:predicted transcriptional regulator